MRKLLAFVALLAFLPSAAHADGSTTMQAPYADGDQITQCQWIAAQTGLGTCTMSAEPVAENGAISVDAMIESPSSPAGAHTLPTWGQAIAQATVYSGYHLDQPADFVKFTFTWHVDEMHFDTIGLPQLAWNNAIAQASIYEVPCACVRQATSVTLSPNDVGADVTATIAVDAHASQGPHGEALPYQPIPSGVFVIKVGFEVQAGLIMTPGLTRSKLTGSVVKIGVDEVDAPPPPEGQR